MKKPVIVSSHEKGEPVPEWLLACDPANDEAVKGEMLFNVPCHIVETTAGYFVVPDEECEHVIVVRDADHIDISAASNNVILPSAFTRLYVEKGRGSGVRLA